MTITIDANSLETSPNIDGAGKVADDLIVSPSYIMKSPSHAFARENSYAKKERVYVSDITNTDEVIKIDSFAGLVEGNIGIHFVEVLMPISVDTSSLGDGTYILSMFVDYTEYAVGTEGALTKLNITFDTIENGTNIATIVKSGGTFTITPNDALLDSNLVLNVVMGTQDEASASMA